MHLHDAVYDLICHAVMFKSKVFSKGKNPYGKFKKKFKVMFSGQKRDCKKGNQVVRVLTESFLVTDSKLFASSISSLVLLFGINVVVDAMVKFHIWDHWRHITPKSCCETIFKSKRASNLELEKGEEEEQNFLWMTLY